MGEAVQAGSRTGRIVGSRTTNCRESCDIQAVLKFVVKLARLVTFAKPIRIHAPTRNIRDYSWSVAPKLSVKGHSEFVI